jgi:BirA family biotin operon repressor/biotin-[acetyl-CoA-carboxylase] ligase
VDGVAVMRQPLDEARLRDGLHRWPFYVDVSVSEATGSTNADVAALARHGAPEGTARATDHQMAGRGRLDRSWISPARAGIAVSVLLRPRGVAPDRWTWLPLLTGLVVARAVSGAGVEGMLKWPNDVLVDGRKIAGILVEVVGPGVVVVGVGLNVSNQPAELPPGATSLAIAGARDLDRADLLAALLGDLADTYTAWRDGGDSEELRAAYLTRCATVGRVVSVELPGGRAAQGSALTIDVDGRLVITSATGELALGAGDVVHVR